MPPPIVTFCCQVGIGEGHVLEDPDQSVAAVHGEIDPGRRARCSGNATSVTPRKANVPAFWKLITQASFHGRGPPGKSRVRKSLARRRTRAQAGAALAEPFSPVAVFIVKSSFVAASLPAFHHSEAVPGVKEDRRCAWMRRRTILGP